MMILQYVHACTVGKFLYTARTVYNIATFSHKFMVRIVHGFTTVVFNAIRQLPPDANIAIVSKQ